MNMTTEQIISAVQNLWPEARAAVYREFGDEFIDEQSLDAAKSYLEEWYRKWGWDVRTEVLYNGVEIRFTIIPQFAFETVVIGGEVSV